MIKEIPTEHMTEGGHREWRLSNGDLHREDGPAFISAAVEGWDERTEVWWRNGVKHRIGGPALKRFDGYEEWWQNGMLHREDGPAKFWPTNHISDWYLDGEWIPTNQLKVIDTSNYPLLQVYQIMHL